MVKQLVTTSLFFCNLVLVSGIASARPTQVSIIENSGSGYSRFVYDAGHITFEQNFVRDGKVLNLKFVQHARDNKLSLLEINVGPNRILNMAIDSGSFGPEPIDCSNKTKLIEPIVTAVDAAVDIPQMDNCLPDQKAAIQRFVKDLLHPARIGSSAPFACQISHNDQEGAKILTAWLTSTSRLAINCSNRTTSAFERTESSATVFLAHSIFDKPYLAGKEEFYHELLHGLGRNSDQEVGAITRCCSDRSTSEPTACDLFDLYRKASRYPIPRLQRFAYAVVDDRRLSLTKKQSILAELSDSGRKIRCEHNEANRNDLLAFAKRTSDACSKVLTPSGCTNLQSEIFNSDNVSACNMANDSTSIVNSVIQLPSEANNRIASAPANPDATSNKPGTQQKLDVVKTETSLSNSKEIQKYEQPMSALGREARDVGSRFIASVGIPSANAATFTLPHQNSDGSSSTELVGMKDGKPLLAIGNGVGMTATLSDPFAGEKESSKVQFYDLKSGKEISSDRVPSLEASASGSAQSTTTMKSLKAQAASLSAASDDSGGASASGGASVSLPSGSTSSRPSARAPSASSQEPQEHVPPSKLQRLIANSPNPLKVINTHIDDLRANAMLVRYMCNWYPEKHDYKILHRFSVDSYQRRDCSEKKDSR